MESTRITGKGGQSGETKMPAFITTI